MIGYWARELLYGVLRVTLSFKRDTSLYVLMYHSVGGDGPLSVSVAEFNWQMRFISLNYDVISLSSALSVSRLPRVRPAICVTFDDGLADLYANALPILERWRIPATFFITTGYIGGLHPVFYGHERCMSATEIKDLHFRGYEIGAHTVSHPKLARIDAHAAYGEIAGSKAVLELITGARVRSFAYPKGSYTEAVEKLVESAGFEVACAVREAACDSQGDRFALPRIAVDASIGRMQFKGKISPAISVYEYIKK